ncbi:hypothetical protein D3C72_2174420 [compost metagenome]
MGLTTRFCWFSFIQGRRSISVPSKRWVLPARTRRVHGTADLMASCSSAVKWAMTRSSVMTAKMLFLWSSLERKGFTTQTLPSL